MPSLLLMLVLLAPATEPRAATEDEYSLFMSHLREHFDDIHDVSMRFHDRDPSLGGRVSLATIWESGRMISGEVAGNETGNDAVSAALVETLKGWRVDGLNGPCRLTTTFRIMLVGSDDPAFPDTAILTGSVIDTQGRPVHRARIEFEGDSGRVPAARSNREGVFVRTLVPPGVWSVSCSAEGYRTVRRKGLQLEAGQHRRERLVLAPASPEGSGEAAD